MTDLAAIRYDLISPLLQRYKRRFTLLDLGAGISPYMAQRISREFDAVVVAIEQDEIKPEELEKFGPRALWLRKKMSAEDLKRLACCENFDGTLALNIFHHFSCEWQEALENISIAADWMILQTPTATDAGTCGKCVTPGIESYGSDHGEKLGDTIQFSLHEARPIYLMAKPRIGRLRMSSWTSPEDCIDARIYSSHGAISIHLMHKYPIKRRPYIHGLNLWNFANLGGSWPRKDAVLKLIREFPLPTEHHGDITPHNFLFDGKDLFLIDGHEGWEFDDAAGLKKTEEMIGDMLQ